MGVTFPRRLLRAKNNSPDGQAIGFNVEDVDKVFEDLKLKGSSVVMPTQREGEGIRLAVFLDPDGLPVSFAQTVVR